MGEEVAWKSESTKMTACEALLLSKAVQEPLLQCDFLSTLLKSRHIRNCHFCCCYYYTTLIWIHILQEDLRADLEV